MWYLCIHFPAELSFCSFSQNKKLQSIRLCRTLSVVGASMRYVTTTAIVYPNTTAPGPGRTPTITAHREAILITYLADTFKMLSQVQITPDESLDRRRVGWCLQCHQDNHEYKRMLAGLDWNRALAATQLLITFSWTTISLTLPVCSLTPSCVPLAAGSTCLDGLRTRLLWKTWRGGCREMEIHSVLGA
jgi:hypothetical protein